MGKLGCSSDGYMDDSKFSEPMPWIGIYVAAASAACALAMALDAVNGFRYRKFWFPCKFFSLNATTLTLIAVAIKLSVDLNTSMPRSQDQLSKLSSTVFICTVMGNFMPSLGNMENKELMMNIVALGILVITVIVNICIQLGTGVIYVFWKEHAFVMLLMLVLLATSCSSALAVPSTKSYLEMKYSKIRKLAAKEALQNTDLPVITKLREKLTRHWMMAHTCNPQLVVGRLATCTASGAFCLLSALTLAEAMLRFYLMRRSFKFCSGESEYKWSTTLILVTQIMAVGVGTVAPAFRWFTALKFRCVKVSGLACQSEFEVEKYWNQKLVERKECPLAFKIWGWRGRKLVNSLKCITLDFCISMQSGIVLVSKLVQFISIFFVSRFLILCRSCSKKLERFLKWYTSSPSNDIEPQTRCCPEMDLSRFVVHLEGEEGLVHLMTTKTCDATKQWFEKGVKKQPKRLMQLLEKSMHSQELKGVCEFDSNQVPSLDCKEPPNCWALPVVTLTSIAAALPNISHHAVKKLKYNVHEALMYVRVIENNLVDANIDLKNSRKAAEIVWSGIDLYHKWLNIDLRAMSCKLKDPTDVLEELTNAAKNIFMNYKGIDINGCTSETPSKWPADVLAANSMYRICQTILLDYQCMTEKDSEMLFEKLSIMISDIVSACLSNLKHVINNHCDCRSIEKREENVRFAVLLLGKTEKIVNNLEQIPGVSGSNPDETAHIDNWRLLNKPKGFMDYSSTDISRNSFSSSDMIISVV